jgi:hypothetical protein
VTGLLGVLTAVAAIAAVTAGPDGAFGVAAVLIGITFLFALRRTRRMAKEYVVVERHPVRARSYAHAGATAIDPRTRRALLSTYRR